VDLVVAGEGVRLYAERALRWGSTLLVADLHWGKSAAFRAAGLPVPDELEADLERLERLVATAEVDRVVVLGDLVHARAGLSEGVLEAVSAFRRRCPVAMTLVRGNHDRHVPELPPSWGIDDRVERVEGPFRFRHHPVPDPDGRYVWAGHVHAGVVVGRGIDRVSFPCFHLGRSVGILPAFGGFTGSGRVRGEPGDRVVAIVPEVGLVEVERPGERRGAPRGGHTL